MKHNIHVLAVGKRSVQGFVFSSAKDGAGCMEKHNESIIRDEHYEAMIEIRVEAGQEMLKNRLTAEEA